MLALHVLGYTNSEIASKLCLAQRTVEAHRKHIQDKVRRRSRAELVTYGREHGLLDRSRRALTLGRAWAGDGG